MSFYLHSGRLKWSICSVFLLAMFMVGKSAAIVNHKILNDISSGLTNVPSPEHNVMPFEQIHFSVANVSNNQYKSTTKFQARGMGHLYFLTKQFMQLVMKGEAYPEGLLSIRNQQLVIADVTAEWRGPLAHYGPMLGVVAAGLLFVALLPIAGLLFCCCRCAGGCGSRSQPFEKRYDPCRRHTLGFCLSGLTILIMFGVVCAFVTNEYLEQGAQELPDSVRTALRDTDLYLNNTKLEVFNLLVTNFDELHSTLNATLHESGEIVKEKLGEISRAVVLSNLTAIVGGLSTIKADLSSIDYLTRALQENAMELEQALKETREKLLSKLTQCKSQKACMDFLRNYNITHLSLEANFTQLPDVTASLSNVSALMAADMEHEVLKGRDEFDKIKLSIQRTVDQNIPLISNNIRRAGVAIKEGAANITTILDTVRVHLNRYAERPVLQGEAYIKEYGHYRYYTGLSIGAALLAVLSCLSFGLLCGYCGRRPDGGYSDDCCDKGTGARFLMLGVWVMFLTGAGLMLVSLVSFVSGVLAERVICQPLRSPGDSRIFQLIDEMVHLDHLYVPRHESPPLNVSSVIKRCHNNESIYQVLHLESVVDISQVANYPQRYGILAQVDQLTSGWSLDRQVDIITPAAEKQLLKLASSPLNDIDLRSYTRVLNEKITSIDLLQLAAALNETANKLPPTQTSLKSSLRNQASYLQFHQERHVATMVTLARYLDGNATQLAEHVRFNRSSLRDAVAVLLKEVEEAQKVLNTRGPSIVRKLASEFGQEFVGHIEYYLARVVSHTQLDVGKCWPLSQVYNATVVAGCTKILDPFNGFWMSVGMIVALFIPAIILSVKLATLYQKSDPYPGPLVEAEYLYDAYADRDNIPLANVHEKKKKKGGGGGGGGDYSGHLGRGGDRGRASSSGAQAHGASSEQRFNDMAPKHWDFPNGGPPRYHSPPLSTEYERPPPYYYPGPAPSSRS